MPTNTSNSLFMLPKIPLNPTDPPAKGTNSTDTTGDTTATTGTATGTPQGTVNPVTGSTTYDNVTLPQVVHLIGGKKQQAEQPQDNQEQELTEYADPNGLDINKIASTADSKKRSGYQPFKGGEPELPAQVTQPQPVLPDESLDDSAWLEAYGRNLLPQEEIDRRMRAGERIKGIQHLGNIFNAFANLYNTGRGAPSQTLPTVPDAKLQEWKDKQQENLKAWIKMRADASKNDAFIARTNAWIEQIRQNVESKKSLMKLNDEKAAKLREEAEILRQKLQDAKDMAPEKLEQLRQETAKKEAEAKKAEWEAELARKAYENAQRKFDDAHNVAVSTVGRNNAQSNYYATKGQNDTTVASSTAYKNRQQGDAAVIRANRPTTTGGKGSNGGKTKEKKKISSLGK